MIVNYFAKSIVDLLYWIPMSGIITITMGIYCPSYIFTIIKAYYIMNSNSTLI